MCSLLCAYLSLVQLRPLVPVVNINLMFEFRFFNYFVEVWPLKARVDRRPDMDLPWRILRCRQPRMGKLNRDKLRHIAVGDPDPTSHPGTANGSQKCGIKWTDETSQTLSLLWTCTRELGHQGQHIAGTGKWVVAVRTVTDDHESSTPQ
jgi:hypothetical protein